MIDPMEMLSIPEGSTVKQVNDEYGSLLVVTTPSGVTYEVRILGCKPGGLFEQKSVTCSQLFTTAELLADVGLTLPEGDPDA